MLKLSVILVALIQRILSSANQKDVLFQMWKRMEYLHYSSLDPSGADHFVKRQREAGAVFSVEALSSNQTQIFQSNQETQVSVSTESPQIPRLHKVKLHKETSGQYYYILLRVGENNTEQSLIVDTGSDLTAFPCGTQTNSSKHTGSVPSEGTRLPCGDQCKGGFCQDGKCLFHRVDL